MRKAKKEIREGAVIVDFLGRCRVGRLGTIGKGGCPMAKRLNFVFHKSKIYFHTAREGEKMDDIPRNTRVCSSRPPYSLCERRQGKPLQG